MKKMKKEHWVILAMVGIAVAAVAVFQWVMPAILFHVQPGAESVAIIGGADGPTSIYVAGKVGTAEVIRGSIISLIVGAVILIGLIIWGKKHS